MQEKNIGNEVDRRVKPYDENKADKSNEENTRKTIEQTTRNENEKFQTNIMKPRTIKLNKLRLNNRK